MQGTPPFKTPSNGRFAPKPRPTLRQARLGCFKVFIDKRRGYRPYGECNLSDTFITVGHIEGGGVYLIGDFYVGRASNVLDRLNQHSYSIKGNKEDSVGLGAREYYERFGNCPIPVRQISDNPDDEGLIYAICRDADFPLWNALTPRIIEIDKRDDYFILGKRDKPFKMH